MIIITLTATSKIVAHKNNKDRAIETIQDNVIVLIIAQATETIRVLEIVMIVDPVIAIKDQAIETIRAQVIAMNKALARAISVMIKGLIAMIKGQAIVTIRDQGVEMTQDLVTVIQANVIQDKAKTQTEDLKTSVLKHRLMKSFTQNRIKIFQSISRPSQKNTTSCFMTLCRRPKLTSKIFDKERLSATSSISASEPKVVWMIRTC
jgi:hypothetical protein